MSKKLTQGDVDIDLLDRTQILSKIDYVRASMITDNKLTPHKTGIYFQEAPIDPITGLCTLDHKHAEELGYLKIDFLNNGLYTGVNSEAHLQQLLDTEVKWSLLQRKDVVEQLYHIKEHFEIVSIMKPTSIEQLAAVLAIIRPGKRYLLGKSWQQVDKEVWVKSEGESYSYKRSHSLAYSLSIVVQINLLVEQGLIK